MLTKTRTTRRSRRQSPVLGVVAAGLLLLGACADDDPNSFSEAGAVIGDSGSDDATTASISPPGTEAMQDEAEAMEDGGSVEGTQRATVDAAALVLGSGGAQTGDEGAALQPVDIGRDIIYNASISVEVDRVGEAADQALQAVQRFGGLLFGQQTTTEGTNRTVLTFRVRPADFQQVVSALGGIGELRDQTISTDDVTERVVNLESQITTSEASVIRLRGFLEGASDLNEIASLENQLLDRETNLELLRGQLRTVRNQVDLATITMTLTERVPGPSLAIVATSYKGDDSGVSCPGDDEVTVDEGDDLTVCLAITNDGDSHLNDFRVADEGFGIDIDDLRVLEGDFAAVLAPGESVRASFTAESVTSSTSIETGVSAQPVEADGTPLGLERTGRRSAGSLQVTPDDSPPGFADSLGRGVDVLQGMVGVVIVLAGFFLPFIWVPFVLWLLWRLIARRKPNLPATSSLPHPDPVS